MNMRARAASFMKEAARHPSLPEFPYPPHRQPSMQPNNTASRTSFVVLDQRNQPTHLVRRVARVHHMGEDVAMERIDAPRSRPGIKYQIVASSRGRGDSVHLLWVSEHLSI